MEKPLTMMFLTHGGFTAAMVLIATVFPAIARAGNAIANDRAGYTLPSYAP